MAQDSVFHEGEVAVQSRVGVRQQAARVGGIIRPLISGDARDFLEEQTFIALGSRDPQGRIWASRRTGHPGFIRVPDIRSIIISGEPIPGDPLLENLERDPQIGMLAIDFAARRRLRLNGIAEPKPSGEITIRAHQVYVNCPKYIQPHEASDPPASAHEHGIRITDSLSLEHQQWIAAADTFFIASGHPEGLDVSHRGGHSGFVRVQTERRFVFPDYSGNNMFNTLGNLTLDPRAGFLFVDFSSGRTLQIAGRSRIVWEPERVIEAEIDRVIEIA